MAKIYRTVNPLPVISEIFEKPVNNGILDHLKKCCLSLISIMVSALLVRLQFSWQMYLIELLGLLIDLGQHEL